MRRKYWPEFQCVKSVHIWSFSGPHFPYSDWIRRNTEYPVFNPNTEKSGPEKLWIWALFTQCLMPHYQSDMPNKCHVIAKLIHNFEARLRKRIIWPWVFYMWRFHKASTILVQCCNTDVWKTLWIWLVVITLYRRCHCNKKDMLWDKFTIQRWGDVGATLWIWRCSIDVVKT